MNIGQGLGGYRWGKNEKNGPRKPGLFEGGGPHPSLRFGGCEDCTLESWNAVSVGYHLAFLKNKQI